MKRKVYIETDRLLLRQWTPSDKPVFFELNSDPKVMEFFPSTLTREQSDSFVNKSSELIEENGWGLFAVELKDQGNFIGLIGLATPTYEAHFTPCTEIGQRLHRNFWKKGYATEGAKAVLDFAFKTLDMHEIVSFTSKTNIPSISLMEKIGMIRDKNGDFDHPKVRPGHPLP